MPRPVETGIGWGVDKDQTEVRGNEEKKGGGRGREGEWYADTCRSQASQVYHVEVGLCLRTFKSYPTSCSWMLAP